MITTLLLILVIQNMVQTPAALGQFAGGSAATGVVGVATGPYSGGDPAAFWIYQPDAKKVLVYTYKTNRLELRAVRDITYDLGAIEFNTRGAGPTVKQM